LRKGYLMSNGSSAKAATKPNGDGFFVRVGKFIREAYWEARFKSSWPTAKELRQFTIVVLFALLVVSVWIGGLDAIARVITDRIMGARIAR